MVIIYGILSSFLWTLLFCRCSYSLSELSCSSISGVFIFLDFTLLPFPVCPCPSLFLGVAACFGWKYFEMVLFCVLCCSRLVLLLLACGVSTVSNSLLLLHIYVYSTACPSYAKCTHSRKEARSPRDFFCQLSVWDVPVSTRELCASTCFRNDEPVVSILGQT